MVSLSWPGDQPFPHLPLQVMVSDGGLYRGDMEHRSSLTMTFQDFLSTADRLNNVKIGAQQLYLAQVPQHLCTSFKQRTVLTAGSVMQRVMSTSVTVCSRHPCRPAHQWRAVCHRCWQTSQCQNACRASRLHMSTCGCAPGSHFSPSLMQSSVQLLAPRPLSGSYRHPHEVASGFTMTVA